MIRKDFVTLVCLATIACVAVRLAFVQGVFRPVRIAGGSMADALCGDHYQLQCRDCGFTVQYDADRAPGDDRVVCPNCGCVNSNLKRADRQSGQRVLLDRWAYRWRQPKRWEMVAFRTREAADSFAVKRVVGLPGETVSIRRGEILIDGQIQQKTLDQLREMAILVHDSAYCPDASHHLPRGWRADRTSSAWCKEGTTFRTALPVRPGPRQVDPELPVSPPGEMDWLTYHHWRCLDNPLPRTDEYAVLDNYGYNQEVSRQLHRVSDLLLVCRGQIETETGVLSLEVHDGRVWSGVRLCFGSRQANLYRGRRPLATASLPPAAYVQDVLLELALCDRQILFAVDRRVVLHHTYQPDDSPTAGAPRPLRIGTDGIAVTMRRLQVFRDLYYLDPAGLGWDWSTLQPMAKDHLFVIGDNAPVSRDSRHWVPRGVPQAKLLGRVLRWP